MRSTVAALLWLVSALAGERFTGRVVDVADGDTISVEAPGHGIKVRLFGVDAPEKTQHHGDASKRFTTDVALGSTVQVIEHDKDRYGRMVAEVVLPDGRSLNKALVVAGHAWWYTAYAPNDTELKMLEADAREHRRGLWAAGNPLPPWEWRKSGPAIAQKAPRRSARRSERRDYR
jgi:endonuclease YncB( thermonuclease family)